MKEKLKRKVKKQLEKAVKIMIFPIKDIDKEGVDKVREVIEEMSSDDILELLLEVKDFQEPETVLPSGFDFEVKINEVVQYLEKEFDGQDQKVIDEVLDLFGLRICEKD